MKKRMMQAVLFLVIIGVVGTSFSEAAGRRWESDVRYFSSGSFYVYGMGSVNNFDPSGEYYLELGMDSATTIAPIVGLGFRILNSRNRFFLNLEFDFTPTNYKFYQQNQELFFYTMMFNAEVKPFRRSPVSFFFGIGGGLISGVDENFTLAFECGIKCPIAKKLFFRSDIRSYGDFSGDYSSQCCDWISYNEDEFNPISTAISVGLEYHF